MRGALSRIARQAGAMDFFDEIETVTERELDVGYVAAHRQMLRRDVRGFGYWIWKPYVIWRALNALEEGDELYYVDAGCHLNPRGRTRLGEYAEMLESNPLGLAAFELTPDCSVQRFTKMDLLVHMGVADDEDILSHSQICATHVFCVKNEQVMAFLSEWLKICENIHLVDDSPSHLPEPTCFVEHRHDQSVFTLLCLRYGAARLPGRETWPENNTRDWSTMLEYPIWDKRDLGFTSHVFSRLLRKMRQKWMRLKSRFS